MAVIFCKIHEDDNRRKGENNVRNCKGGGGARSFGRHGRKHLHLAAATCNQPRSKDFTKQDEEQTATKRKSKF